MLVADRGGPTMFARIGVMRALNRHVERVFDPSRKEKRWGHPSQQPRGDTEGRMCFILPLRKRLASAI
jgi:hypothetical protein